MLYKLIRKIMDRSIAEKVGIDVAFDMITNEEGKTPEICDAYKFYHKYRYEITALRGLGRLPDVRKMCEWQEAGEYDKLKDYAQELSDKGVVR